MQKDHQRDLSQLSISSPDDQQIADMLGDQRLIVQISKPIGLSYREIYDHQKRQIEEARFYTPLVVMDPIMDKLHVLTKAFIGIVQHDALLKNLDEHAWSNISDEVLPPIYQLLRYMDLKWARVNKAGNSATVKFQTTSIGSHVVEQIQLHKSMIRVAFELFDDQSTRVYVNDTEDSQKSSDIESALRGDLPILLFKDAVLGFNAITQSVKSNTQMSANGIFLKGASITLPDHHPIGGGSAEFVYCNAQRETFGVSYRMTLGMHSEKKGFRMSNSK